VHNALVQLLPIPCPAHLIPDTTSTDAFHDVYRTAMAQQAVFVAIESERRQRWTVEADTLTAGAGTLSTTPRTMRSGPRSPAWSTTVRSIWTQDRSTS
jgi:hypothetical protein